MKFLNIKKLIKKDIPIKKLKEIINDIKPDDVKKRIEKGEKNVILNIIKNKVKN